MGSRDAVTAGEGEQVFRHQAVGRRAFSVPTQPTSWNWSTRPNFVSLISFIFHPATWPSQTAKTLKFRPCGEYGARLRAWKLTITRNTAFCLERYLDCPPALPPSSWPSSLPSSPTRRSILKRGAGHYITNRQHRHHGPVASPKQTMARLAAHPGTPYCC